MGEEGESTVVSENALNEGEVFFIDGSASINPDTGEKHVGIAVVRMEEGEYEVIVQHCLTAHYSAQAAELIALIEALHAAKGCAVTIYTDSAYMTTTVHGGLARWGQRGFHRVDGSPVQHAELLKELIEALKEPTMVAIVKCQSHTTNTDVISLGNAATKEASYLVKEQTGEYLMHQRVEEELPDGYNTMPVSHILELQEGASEE
ncbi:ribonuclease H-like [Ambystoma mexicanum]|uniref:ribonuclease H-like n=1 Tax=Ambystoma mexicanum TaxID=8296 RepID=UPI0037E78C36